MRRAQLIILGLLLLGIIIFASIILLLNNSEDTSPPTNEKNDKTEKFYERGVDVKNGYFYLNDSKNSLVLFAEIKTFQKKGEVVDVVTSTMINGKEQALTVNIFNRSISRVFNLFLAAPGESLYGPSHKLIRLGDPEKILQETKPIVGSLAQFIFPLTGGNTDAINCNKKLAEGLQSGKLDLNCMPFAGQIATYAK